MTTATKLFWTAIFDPRQHSGDMSKDQWAPFESGIHQNLYIRWYKGLTTLVCLEINEKLRSYDGIVIRTPYEVKQVKMTGLETSND